MMKLPQKFLMKSLFWISLASGLVTMIYSISTFQQIKPVFNIKSVGPTTYQADVSCSRTHLISLLQNCQNLANLTSSTWIIPPVCPVIDSPYGEHIQSWGPVVFVCQNPNALKSYLGYHINNDQSVFFWRLGMFLFVSPLAIICFMFLLIGVYQYFKFRLT